MRAVTVYRLDDVLIFSTNDSLQEGGFSMMVRL